MEIFMTDPTRTTYPALAEAYDFFNTRLFKACLPRCLITMQRKERGLRLFSADRFGTRGGNETTDEIALNPSHFRARTIEQSLSTLVHEMTHLEQHHFGVPSRAGYHNKEWAQMMHRVELVPSTTGVPGGNETGQHVSHYIESGGPFETACADLMRQGFDVRYVELWGDPETRKKKAASKTKYSCPTCGTNAWAKPTTNLICGDCDRVMTSNLKDERLAGPGFGDADLKIVQSCETS
jgi:predicted SprT family Zn-dependent metalloprotease